MIYPVSYNYDHSIYNNIGAYNRIRSALDPVGKVNKINPLGEKENLTIGKTKSSECQTCKSRKYVDQSGDSNVSFKTPAHISPQDSYGKVAAHESQHVANARSEGGKPGAQLLSASVSLKMELCPECGSPYVAGGETRTVLKYEVDNPYEKERKKAEEALVKGINVDYVA